MNPNDPVTSLGGVGDKVATKLEKLGINTISDLLDHFPRNYLDLRIITPISRLEPKTTVCLRATVISKTHLPTRGRLTIQKAKIKDDSGTLYITWFNQPFILPQLQLNKTYFFSGQVTAYKGQLSLNTPTVEPVSNNPLHAGRIVPIYSETKGLTSKWLRNKIYDLLGLVHIDEPLTPKYLQGELPQATAYNQIHFPSDEAEIEAARNRLAFNDLLAVNLKSELIRLDWQQKLGPNIKVDQEKHKQLLKQLPFKLTKGQTTAINAIFTDFAHTYPSNRLLQGDVGSGKTIVAIAAALQSLHSDHSVVIMAPTQVLAQQHQKTFTDFLKPFKIKPLLITSSSKPPKSNLKSPKSKLYIGTHALLHHKDLLPTNLGLVVIDEQHRFGVHQRNALLSKKSPPHLLTMTATPIPRTLALSVFGHLSVSDIKEKPNKRKQVKTWVVPENKRTKAYQWLEKQIKTEKSQAFVVCPLIDESDHDTLKNTKAASTEYKRLKTVLKQLKLDLLHGRIKPNEKDSILQDFKSKKTDVLVSTPVIEVGIDIPNATIMIIEGAERFGLAALHQLRGRVGRGDKQSYCLLFASSEDEGSLNRLKLLEKHHNGFTLAKLDLKIRGAGSVFGTEQSGHLDTQFKAFWSNTLKSKAKVVAQDIVKSSPETANNVLTKLNQSLAKSLHTN